MSYDPKEQASKEYIAASDDLRKILNAIDKTKDPKEIAKLKDKYKLAAVRQHAAEEAGWAAEYGYKEPTTPPPRRYNGRNGPATPPPSGNTRRNKPVTPPSRGNTGVNEYAKLSISELKAALKLRGVSTDGMLEKGEMLAALRAAQSPRRAPPPPPTRPANNASRRAANAARANASRRANANAKGAFDRVREAAERARRAREEANARAKANAKAKADANASRAKAQAKNGPDYKDIPDAYKNVTLGKVADFYKTLGVPRTAQPADIKRAFRAKSLVSHPNKGGDPEIFKAISTANEVLSDAEEKGKYDAYLKEVGV